MTRENVAIDTYRPALPMSKKVELDGVVDSLQSMGDIAPLLNRTQVDGLSYDVQVFDDSVTTEIKSESLRSWAATEEGQRTRLQLCIVDPVAWYSEELEQAFSTSRVGLIASRGRMSRGEQVVSKQLMVLDPTDDPVFSNLDGVNHLPPDDEDAYDELRALAGLAMASAQRTTEAYVKDRKSRRLRGIMSGVAGVLATVGSYAPVIPGVEEHLPGERDTHSAAPYIFAEPFVDLFNQPDHESQGIAPVEGAVVIESGDADIPLESVILSDLELDSVMGLVPGRTGQAVRRGASVVSGSLDRTCYVVEVHVPKEESIRLGVVQDASKPEIVDSVATASRDDQGRVEVCVTATSATVVLSEGDPLYEGVVLSKGPYQPNVLIQTEDDN